MEKLKGFFVGQTITDNRTMEIKNLTDEDSDLMKMILEAVEKLEIR
jgi:hypothetical protein